MTLHTEYLVGAKGDRKSVVLPMKDFARLMDYLEDLEDAVDLKKAKKSARNFMDFDQFTRQLKRS